MPPGGAYTSTKHNSSDTLFLPPCCVPPGGAYTSTKLNSEVSYDAGNCHGTRNPDKDLKYFIAL